MATKQTQASETYGFRVVVRGNLDGRRVRRVRTVQASDAAQAFEAAGPVAAQASEGLSDVFYNVYPPVGQLCNGGVSKGFEVTSDGYIVRSAAQA